MVEPISLTMTFRDGQTETQGIIERVSYETQGHDVLVTSTDGLAKGTTVRYTLVDADDMRSPLGEFHRVP